MMLRKIIQEELQRDLREGPDASETGGGTIATIKKGLSIAFPDWAGDIDNLDLKSSLVDEFASLVKNAMLAAGEGKLVQADKASEKLTASIT